MAATGSLLRRLTPHLVMILGVAAAMGQAPWNLWWLALPAYAGAFHLIGRAPSRGQTVLRAWAFGLGHFLMALNWIREPFRIDAGRDGWMATPALLLLAAGLALFWAAAGATVHRLPPGAQRIWGLALALAAAEALRGIVLTGFPWALPGHIWIAHAPGQIAAWAGAGGLTLLTLGLAALPAAHRLHGGALAVMLLVPVWGLGWQRQQAPLPPPVGAVIRLVQPNADQALKWDPDHAREFFVRLLDLSSAPAAYRPDLVVWPETAVPFLLDDPGLGLQMIADRMPDTPVVLGIQRTEGLLGFNSLAVIGRDADGLAEIQAVYDKHQLVPFGEYIPGGDLLAEWLGIFSFSPSEGHGYSAGSGPAVLRLADLPSFQPLICYEAVFPWFQRAVPRPDWLLQITNDAWFGKAAGPQQHLALARLRAIENGLPLLRAANTGISTAFDARGRMIEQLGLQQQGVLDIALPGALPPTAYARLGIWPATLLWILGALLLFRGRSVTN